jgi:hypothetical protein
MADSPELHPSIRVNPDPRMSAVALAEYLILKSDPQATVLHDSRYSQTNIRAAYAAARSGLREYNTDYLRPIGTLNKVKESLTRRANDPTATPRSRAAALREIELIDLFILRENGLGLRGLPLEKPPRFASLKIEGVALSVQPDVIVMPLDGRVGAAMIRVTKAPDPDAVRLPATKQEKGEHRREIGRYLIAMMDLLLNENPEWPGKVDRDLIFVSDVRLGEKITAAPDHAARINDIHAGCKQIANIWHTIQPRPGILKKP